MGEACELLLHRGDYLRVAVARIEYGDAAGEVDVAAAFDVPQFGVLCPRGEDLVGLLDPIGDGGAAALISGWQWPVLSTAMPPAKSM